ncbi:hypothetical protein BC643_1104 [Mangrovibacterium diazotrophicum]|uniref:Uncharacterized protein n=1 Tax=Mangrovibacterium diazotrophicum TaxID=1261403 RepID=A0A419W5L9_9BACT|nr:hypothetical protein BC643_1104 [Mangrovibacterium diazotrophicum]
MRFADIELWDTRYYTTDFSAINKQKPVKSGKSQ